MCKAENNNWSPGPHESEIVPMYDTVSLTPVGVLDFNTKAEVQSQSSCNYSLGFSIHTDT